MAKGQKIGDCYKGGSGWAKKSKANTSRANNFKKPRESRKNIELLEQIQQVTESVVEHNKCLKAQNTNYEAKFAGKSTEITRLRKSNRYLTKVNDTLRQNQATKAKELSKQVNKAHTLKRKQAKASQNTLSVSLPPTPERVEWLKPSEGYDVMAFATDREKQSEQSQQVYVMVQQQLEVDTKKRRKTGDHTIKRVVATINNIVHFFARGEVLNICEEMIQKGMKITASEICAAQDMCQQSTLNDKGVDIIRKISPQTVKFIPSTGAMRGYRNYVHEGSKDLLTSTTSANGEMVCLKVQPVLELLIDSCGLDKFSVTRDDYAAGVVNRRLRLAVDYSCRVVISCNTELVQTARVYKQL